MTLKAMTLVDFECQNRGFYGFCLWFPAARHNSRANFTEITRDTLGQLAYEIFDIKRRFKQSKSRPHRFKVTCTWRHQRWAQVNLLNRRLLNCISHLFA